MNKVLLSGFKEINIEKIRQIFNQENDLLEIDQQNGCIILTYSNSQIAQKIIADWNDKEFDGNILTLQLVQMPEACYSCGKHGHIARFCPKEQIEDKCFNCGNWGHWANDCDQYKCFKCGNLGHLAKDCVQDINVDKK